MIWIISGTQDGREIGARLADWMQKQPEDHRADILMTVVSQYGKILAEHEGITIEVPGPNKIIIHGCDKQQVGQFAAEVREKRPPEPYKGKGIKYTDEVIRRKAGKTGAKK